VPRSATALAIISLVDQSRRRGISMPAGEKKSVASKPLLTNLAAGRISAILLSALEELNIFVGVCDRKFMPVYCNRQGMKMVGLDSLQQARRTPVEEWFFPEDRDFIRETFFPSVVKKGQNEVEIRFRHFKTGEALWMLYSVEAVKDDRGNVQGYATVSHNITQRKTMEAQIKLDEKWLQIAYVDCGLAPWEYDPGIECFFLPGDAAELLGFKRSEHRLALSRLLARVESPEDGKALTRVFANHRPAKQLALAFTVRLPDGKLREISCHGRLFYDQGRDAMLGVFAELKRSSHRNKNNEMASATSAQ
jgi:PAS domain S-box-containing protein